MMKSTFQVFLVSIYGIGVWGVNWIVSIFLEKSSLSLILTQMILIVLITISATVFYQVLIRKHSFPNTFSFSIIIGILWATSSVVIDYLLFIRIWDFSILKYYFTTLGFLHLFIFPTVVVNRLMVE